jgi:peptide/nickel transport system permease protein
MHIAYVLKRFGQFLIVLWGAATLNFLLPRVAPGNPVRERLLDALATGGTQQQGIEEMVRAYNKEFGLDQPLWVQYFQYLWHALHFDFGYSITNYPARASSLIFAALPWTIGLLLVSTVLAFALGTILGALIAWPKAPGVFHYLVVPMMALTSIPYYLLGLVLVYVFAIVVPLFPVSGGYAIGAIPSLSLPFALDIAKHSLLPALSITVVAIGFWALGMRGMMVTTDGEDFMGFAEAKGLHERRIFMRYAVRNAVLPQVTAFALSLGHIVSGSVVVEVVFGYPGIGSLLFRSIAGLDYFVIYGIVFMVVLSIALATILVDLTYPLLDPRIAYRRA